MSPSQKPSVRVAILVADGFEQVEMTEPRRVLQEAGFTTELVSPARGKVQGMNHIERADIFPVDVQVDAADPDPYDALVLPGGVWNPDALRINDRAMAFVRHFTERNKPIAAICHGPWSLVEVGAVRGKRLTSWPSLRTDIVNAGGTWLDETVVIDGSLVTSRKPADLPAFTQEAVRLFARSAQGDRVPASSRS